jgi:hypothetical protein
MIVIKWSQPGFLGENFSYSETNRGLRIPPICNILVSAVVKGAGMEPEREAWVGQHQQNLHNSI